MQLSTIEIEGFKSFPKRTRLTFTPGITAIIGPNGSGKSNVTEAIRWVLGEQSIKQLRGKDSRDVIFHGTNQQSAAQRARVTLTFANESGRFPGGAAEVAVSRSLTRDGESRYIVNGDDVRLTDLQRLLAEAGIGTRATAVISQGMVDRYLAATPAGRKELFDEATGVRSLQIQLQEAHRKLQKTQQHTAEIETIVRELTPRLTVLRRQVKRYEQRQKMEETFQQRQRAWFSHAWLKANSAIEASRTHLADLRRKIELVRKQRIRLEQTLMQSNQDNGHQATQVRLAQAQAAFIQQQRAFENYQTQQRFLKESLSEIGQKKEAAKIALARARETSLQFDWLHQSRMLAERCVEYLGSLLRGQNPKVTTQSLIADINSYLQQTQSTTTTQATQLMIRAIEKPLQAVARLSTLEQERNQSLGELQVVAQPTREEIEKLEAMLETADQSLPGANSKLLEDTREQELEAERSLGAAQAAAQQHGLELARLEEDILRECGSKTLRAIQQSELPQADDIPSEAYLRELAAKLAAIGEPDPLVQKEYTEVLERHAHLTKQLTDIRETATNIVDLMGNLHQRMQQQFAQQFMVIQKSFAAIFSQLFGGGKAQITQTEEGVEIAVTPPGKRSRHVSLLSGGERALTSLALLMAILEAQTPPFLVLDEVEAALDEANSRRFAQLLRKQCSHTQCIVVTHNREIMSVADVLYGVTMAREGISSVYSVQLSDVNETVPEGSRTQEMHI